MEKRPATEQLAHLGREIAKLEEPVLVIPEGYPEADAVRANVAKFLAKNRAKVMHLIMILHEHKADTK